MNIEKLTPRQKKKYAAEALYDAARLEVQYNLNLPGLQRNLIKAQLLIRLAIVKKLTA